MTRQMVFAPGREAQYSEDQSCNVWRHSLGVASTYEIHANWRPSMRLTLIKAKNLSRSKDLSNDRNVCTRPLYGCSQWILGA
jgi:hypothetical protein